MEVVLPAERSVPANDLIVLRQADSHSILNTITDIMKLLDAEPVVAGPIYKFKRHIIIEKRTQNLKLRGHCTLVDLRILDNSRRGGYHRFEFPLAAAGIFFQRLLWFCDFIFYLIGFSECALSFTKDHLFTVPGIPLPFSSCELDSEVVSVFRLCFGYKGIHIIV